MTDQPSCDRCRGPIHDQAYVCGHCGSRLRRDLELVASVAGEASLTIARLAVVERVGGRPGEDLEPDPVDEPATRTMRVGTDLLARREAASALYPKPLPVDLAAAERHDQAVNQLTTWVRHIAETRGLAVPAVRTGLCHHESCTARRRGLAHGPVCEREAPQHPTAAAVMWLVDQLDWLRHRPEAGEAFDALAGACWTIVRVVDRPAEQVLVGRCPCDRYLYARRGADQVRCSACGTTYDVESSRDELKRQLDQSLFTAAELATLVAYFGEGQRGPVRKLINQWSVRGLIAVHDYQGEPAYRFGEVLARLAASSARAG